MILSDFVQLFMSRPNVTPPPTIYVFKDEGQADEWIKEKYNMHKAFEAPRSYKLDMTIHTDMELEYTVNQRWCDAEVQQFYAVEPDTIVVVVEPDCCNPFFTIKGE